MGDQKRGERTREKDEPQKPREKRIKNQNDDQLSKINNVKKVLKATKYTLRRPLVIFAGSFHRRGRRNSKDPETLSFSLTFTEHLLCALGMTKSKLYIRNSFCKRYLGGRGRQGSRDKRAEKQSMSLVASGFREGKSRLGLKKSGPIGE